MSAHLPVVAADAFTHTSVDVPAPALSDSLLDAAGTEQQPQPTEVEVRRVQVQASTKGSSGNAPALRDVLASTQTYAALASEPDAVSETPFVLHSGINSSATDALDGQTSGVADSSSLLLRCWRKCSSEQARIYVACFWLLVFWVANNIYWYVCHD
jgi:hypothetical protein